MKKKIMPIWAPVIRFNDEAPEDAERILKDCTRIVAYDKSFGRISRNYYRMTCDDNMNYDLMVEKEVVSKNGKKTHIRRHFSVTIEILNRVWDEIVSPGGNKVFVSRRIPWRGRYLMAS